MGFFDWLFGRPRDTVPRNQGYRRKRSLFGKARFQPLVWPDGVRLGVSDKDLWGLAQAADRLYRTRQIETGRGKTRTLHCPVRRLLTVQRAILHGLLDNVPLEEACHGFRKGRSIVTHASQHIRQEMVLAVDVRDFFPSITSARVFGVFRSLDLADNTATCLTRLTTCRGILPQGAPTSPAIANLVCRHLDRRLSGLARRMGINYSRYADDLTFSGPVRLADYKGTIERIVREEGFEPNARKCRFMRRHQRQVVTGLTVNDGVSIPRPWRRRLRGLVHRVGCETAVDVTPETLFGMLSFLKMVHPELYRRELETLGLGPLMS